MIVGFWQDYLESELLQFMFALNIVKKNGLTFQWFLMHDFLWFKH